MPLRFNLACPCLSVLVCLCPLFCSAQSAVPASDVTIQVENSAKNPESQPGSVNGTVIDRSGAVVIGAQVTIARGERSLSPGSSSGTDGEFFFPNVAPGSKIVERPNPSLTYYPVTRSTIERVTVILTDQNNKPIDLRGEIVTVRVAIRKVKDIKNSIKRAIKELKNENII